MSQNGVNNPSQYPRVAQYTFNGVNTSQNSSRGSSPSLHIAPARTIPASQLPPGAVKSVTDKVSQISVHAPSQFSSTPSNPTTLPKRDLTDSLPVTSRIDNGESRQSFLPNVPLGSDHRRLLGQQFQAQAGFKPPLSTAPGPPTTSAVPPTSNINQLAPSVSSHFIQTGSGTAQTTNHRIQGVSLSSHFQTKTAPTTPTNIPMSTRIQTTPVSSNFTTVPTTLMAAPPSTNNTSFQSYRNQQPPVSASFVSPRQPDNRNFPVPQYQNTQIPPSNFVASPPNPNFFGAPPPIQVPHGAPPPVQQTFGAPLVGRPSQPINSRPPPFSNNFVAPTPNQAPPYDHRAQFPTGAANVVQHGFNKLWGAEHHDLLQTLNVLPSGKIEPPQIRLGNENLNAANCSGEIFRTTITKVPETQSLLNKSRLPLGILIHPFKDLTQLSVIQCNVIVRCRACRTYINPFVSFVDSKRWKCNLCYRVNDLPDEFQYDPVSKTYGDPSRRPEIRSSTIEYIAPAEYMLRPPQPAVYLFLLDVSRAAVECGYLTAFVSVLKDELRNLPGDARTQIGFVAFDSQLHFFKFGDGDEQAREMLVLDVDDVFLPSPDNLLVNLGDKASAIVDLLDQLPNRYANTMDTNCALGAALQAAHKMMSATGGRVTVFQCGLPNVGPGALTAREDPNRRSSIDVQHLKPANDFYKRLALDCSAQQIAVDLFVANSQYVDLATVAGVSKFSGGCVHHFPLFKVGRPILSERFERTFRRYLTRKIGFEAVMRVRCSRGLSIHTFHGNFFVRSTDLLSLPNVNPDAGYGMQISIDESLSDVENVCFQAALLYTSSKGERRIRVHTLCLPVAANLHDVINSADQQCIIGLLAKMAVDRSVDASLSDAREAFINVVVDVLSSYKLSLNMGSNPNGLLAPDCLKLLPLYISALLKHLAFRTGQTTRLDDRVKAMIDMKTKPLQALMQNVYPDLYPIHQLDQCETVLNAEEEPVQIPRRLQLTSRLIDSNGAFLMDTGNHMMIYVGSAVPLSFLRDVFGVPDYGSLNDIYEIPNIANETNSKLLAFINYLNEDKPYVATLQIIKDNSPSRTAFLERLIEDRVENALSYHEFLQHIRAQVK